MQHGNQERKRKIWVSGPMTFKNMARSAGILALSLIGNLLGLFGSKKERSEHERYL